MNRYDQIRSKNEWTDSDLGAMNWQDSTIYAWFARKDSWELFFDIDYVLEMGNVSGSGSRFSYSVAPATLFFSSVYNVRVNVYSPSGTLNVVSLERFDPMEAASGAGRLLWSWRMHCNEGDILLRGSGFRLRLRRPPSLSRRRTLAFADRGGVSFRY